MLANCAVCRRGKLYGAYYNAAAHLRRVHFYPRQKGRNTKGRLDYPAMEELKQHWMKEVQGSANESILESNEET